MTKTSLLDLMAVQTQCIYISDLKRIDRRNRLLLAERLGALAAEDGDLRDWNDALEYLTGEKSPYAGAEQAKAALIVALADSAPWGGI